ncbi:MAG TPA: class F sortase [Chloroflexia bacterium]|nr:class F sortase [Chloroflexia bacterium]
MQAHASFIFRCWAGTARPLRGLLAALLGVALLPAAGLSPPRAGAAASAFTFADSSFDLLWLRTDAGVAGHSVTRSWIWGPAPGVAGLEAYADAPDGSGQRLVQYWDKGRMEVNTPLADPSTQWFVTSGLLTVELMTGRQQQGNTAYLERAPAQVPIAGDTGDATAPTYASFLGVSNTPRGEHRQPDRRGQVVTDVISRDGSTTTDAGKSRYPGLRVTYYDPRTGHNVPEIFMNFLTQSGPVYQGGATTTRPLFDPWVFTMGLPISDPYWATVQVAGQPQDVLIQAFERRVLTYQPSADPPWRVQMGNIGLHYYKWRYGATWYDGVIGPAPRPAADPALPHQLVIPKLGVRATVESLGVDAHNDFDIPRDPWDVGWYAPGTRPGAPGNAAMDGHLDWYHVGPVVFWRLGDLQPGDRYWVRDASGRDYGFVATETATCPYNDCPLQRIFGASSGRHLNLITCHGTFDRAARNYDKRLVVYGDLMP